MLALGDGDFADIGPVRVWLEDAQRLAVSARALHAAILHIDAPQAMRIRCLPGIGVAPGRRRGSVGAGRG